MCIGPADANAGLTMSVPDVGEEEATDRGDDVWGSTAVGTSSSPVNTDCMAN